MLDILFLLSSRFLPANHQNLGNYAFGYKEDHAEGGTFRKESGNAHGQVIGSYGLRVNDAYGVPRIRVVNYVADDFGFRASIATNEPGVAPQASAATSISSPAGESVAPAPAVVEDVHPVATDVHAAEPLVAAHPQAVAVDAHGPAPIAAPIGAPIAAPIGAPIASAGPAYTAPYAGPIVQEAPATLIKNYAGSIYWPSLLTDNVIFSKPVLAAAAPLAGPSVAYEAPLSPNYGIPAALETHDGAGYYEPTLVYSNPR